MRYVSILLLAVCSGCGWQYMAPKEVVTETITIRRLVVGNDWVYVKTTNTLYARYTPTKGVGPLRIYKGNKAMLTVTPAARGRVKGFDNKITKWNRYIQVYGNFEKARKAHPSAKISPESVKYIPKKFKQAEAMKRVIKGCK